LVVFTQSDVRYSIPWMSCWRKMATSMAVAMAYMGL